MRKIMIALGACLLATSVTAQELPLEDYFFGFESCYGRTYSQDHLKKHPDQQVIDISLSHFPTKQEFLGMDSPYQPYPDTPRFAAKLSLFKRGLELRLDAEALCQPDGRKLRCSLECDAGHFFLQAHKSGGLLMTGGNDIYFSGCDAGDDKVLRREPDDQSFLLFPAPRSLCVPR